MRPQDCPQNGKARRPKEKRWNNRTKLIKGKVSNVARRSQYTRGSWGWIDIGGERISKPCAANNFRRGNYKWNNSSFASNNIRTHIHAFTQLTSRHIQRNLRGFTALNESKDSLLISLSLQRWRSQCSQQAFQAPWKVSQTLDSWKKKKKKRKKTQGSTNILT